MPLYEYRCRACGVIHEVLVRGSEPDVCPSCDVRAELERVISSFSVTTPGGSLARLQKARADYKDSQKDKRIAAREERERHQH